MRQAKGHTNYVSTVVAIYLNPWCYRLAVMPGRGCFPGCLLPHAEWCSIIALCPPPAAAAQRRMGAVYTKTVALQSALPRSTLIVLLQCISQHEDCTQNQYSGHWWEHLQSIGTYSNVCRVVPNSRRQLVGILTYDSLVGALFPLRMLDLLSIMEPGPSSRDPAAVMTHHWLVRPPRCGRLVCVKPPITVPVPPFPAPHLLSRVPVLR